MTPNHKTAQTQVKFNQGKTLLHLANKYPTLFEVVLELVQNALDTDVNATRIWITINYQSRYLSVRDNGAGTSVVKFNRALASVAEPRRKGTRSLGQFGLGLISPLGKCEYFTFTSCPEPHRASYQEWRLDTKQIDSQAGDIFVPTRPRNDLVFEDRVTGKTTREWRSEVVLEKFTTDDYVSRLTMETLIGGIRDRYNMVMLRNKVKISIRITHVDGKEDRRDDVTAQEFKGQKLVEQELRDANMGKVLFKMFVAPKSKSGRQGKVLMGVIGNDFRFPFHYLAQTALKLLGEETVLALSSGIFEGEILSEKARLHASRNTFEKDDHFIGLCIAIEEWFDKFGRQYMEEARQCRREERFQQLGLRSMKVLENLLEDPFHSPLRDVINSFARGTIGTGHAEPTNRVLGEQEKKSLSASDGNTGSPRQKNDGEHPDRHDPKEPKPNHMPLTVTGPKGDHRKLVRGHSMGLAFSYDTAEGSPDLWRLDTKIGVLHFNIRHPLWCKCDERSDAALMKLQELVAIQALTLQIMPDNLRDTQRKVLDELNQSVVSWLLKSDKARGTIPTRKTKQKD